MENRILFVDFDQSALDGYKRSLHNKFNVSIADSGEEALQLIKNSGPFSVIISEYKLPDLDGIKFLSTVRKVSSESIRVMLTGSANFQTTVDAVNHANIFRFLTKPCSFENIQRMLNDAVKQYELVIYERELLKKTLKGSIKVLVDVLSVVNPIAFSRTSRILQISKRLSTNFDPEIKWQIEIAALLSQIGCVAVPGEILEKKSMGFTLTPKEKELYFSHPETGKSLINNIPSLEEVSEAIAYQLKKFKGIDENLDSKKNQKIAVIARILKHANDINTMIEVKNSDNPSALELQKKYYPDIDKVIETEISEYEKNFDTKRMTLKNLAPGMISGQDIVDKNGIILVSLGQELSEALIIRLLNLAQLKEIIEPITTYVPKISEPE
jgi:response regulator RpfG family c-di-GMP phosphodiesterase